MIRYGVLWFFVATLIQLGVGSWFLLSLRSEVMMMFMGGDSVATGLFVVALACALGSLALMLMGYASSHPVAKVVAGVILITITVMCMVLMRDIVRNAYLDRYFDPSRYPVEPQTGVIILFFLLLAVGLGVVGYMVRKVVTAR